MTPAELAPKIAAAWKRRHPGEPAPAYGAFQDFAKRENRIQHWTDTTTYIDFLGAVARAHTLLAAEPGSAVAEPSPLFKGVR